MRMSVAKKLQAITETSCLVNVMHEILVDCWRKRIPSIAICPSQRLEQKTGYDVALPGMQKSTALQFKAYYRRNYRACDYFKLDSKQQSTLRKYPKDCAFYVFPDYKTHDDMIRDRQLELAGKPFEILNKTWFVEVHNIPRRAKKVIRNDLLSGRIPSFRWRSLSKTIATCEAGFRIVKRDEQYFVEDKQERRIKSIPIPTGSFSLFYTGSVPVGELTSDTGVIFT